MTMPRRRKVWQHTTENISEDQISEYFHRLEWEVDRFGKDYGEDLFIRIFEEGAFIGKAFFVQLKGTNDIQQYVLQTGVFSYSVDVVNLLQWHRNLFPVIFVLWDIEQRVGYWLDIKSYVDKKLKKDPLWLKPEEGTRKIHLPSDQIISQGEDNALLTLINTEPPLSQMLADVHHKLETADPHYRLEARLTKEGTEIIAVEKYPGASAEKPLTMNSTFTFPTDTEEGRALIKGIEQLRATGAPINIPLSYVQNLEIPEFIKKSLPEITKEGFFALKSAPSSKPLLMRFDFTNDQGKQFTLEYVHLKATQAGQEEVTFTNDEQPILIKVKFIVRANNYTWTTHFSFQPSPDMNAHQILQQSEMQRCLSRPFTCRVTNLETGFSWTMNGSSAFAIDASEQHFFEVIQALNKLQRKTGKLVILPERDLTSEEVQILERLRLLFLTGKQKEDLNGFTLTTANSLESREEVRQWLDCTEKTIVRSIHSEDSITLFGQEYSLGKTKSVSLEGKLANEQEVREALASQAESEIQLEFVLNGDSTFIKEYLDWIPDTGKTSLS